MLPLTLDELKSIRAICQEYSNRLRNLSFRIPVKDLCLVHYEWRSLEQNGNPTTEKIPLTIPTHENCEYQSSVNEEQVIKVRSVLDEWNDVESYLPCANRSGSRLSSYREATPFPGLTLVASIGTEVTENKVNGLSELLSQLKDSLEALFPNRFIWFSPDSLHCTIRSLL